MQETEYQPYNVDEFVCKWKTLWSKVAALPNFHSDLKNRIFVDVMNEPDSMDIKWEWHHNRPGAHQLYLQTADALHSITPDGVLFMFEGWYELLFVLLTGQQMQSAACSPQPHSLSA
jgi:hypothetical protein